MAIACMIEYEIDPFQRESLGHMLDLLGHVEDHLARIAVLAQLAIDPAFQAFLRAGAG